MSASSDYGVSIVESFTPPANWQPGQEINKDVYAVNTGNIDAFVKETVKGVLDYTYESKVATWSDKCVTLEDTAKTAIDGATTDEAGGFLAWTSVDPATKGYIAPGAVVSARETESPAVNGRWTPTAEGVYIFRRAIAATKDGEGKTTGYTYEYAGYYFVPGSPAEGAEGEPGYVEAVPDKYYKIVIGNDNFRAATENTNTTPVSFVYDISASSSQLGGTAVVGEDGVITGTPDIHYVLLNKIDNADVNFGYTSVNDDARYGADYLTVRYDNTSGDMETATAELAAAQEALDSARDELADATTAELGAKSKALTAAEVAYNNAVGAYNSAKSRYDQTKADYDYAAALQAATQDLLTAANARQDAEDDRDDLYSDLETARDAVKDEAADEKNTFTTEMNSNTENYAFDVLIPAAVQNLINSNGPDGRSDLSGAKQNMEAMRALWSQIKSLETAIKNDYDALNRIKTDRDLADTTTSTQIETMMKQLEDDMEALQTAIASYKATYQTLANTLAEASLTGLVTGSTVNNMSVTNNTTDMHTAVETYKDAYDDYDAYLHNAGDDNYTAKVQAWADAVVAYNNAVSTAKSTYVGKVNTVQDEPNAFAYLQGDIPTRTLKNYKNTLVNTYTQLSGTAVGETASDDYTKYAGKTVATIASEADFLQIEGDTTTYPNTNSEAKQKLGVLKTALGDNDSGATKAKNEAENTYNTAKTALEDDGGYTDFAAAQAAYVAAQNDLADAQAAVNAAATGSSIEIDVVLDAGVNATTNPTWTVAPSTINTNAVDFYLNQVLNAGHTSPKLIDKVVMRDSVDSRDYKDLTFDLNVALKSAQVTYADDQRTYTTDAVVAPDFNMTPTVTGNEDVAWS